MSEYKFSLLHSILGVGMNILLLGSVFLAMYRASLNPEDFNMTFFKTIFTLVPLVLIVCLSARRLLNRRRPLPQNAGTTEP